MVAVTTLSDGTARHTSAGRADLRGISVLQKLVNGYPDSCELTSRGRRDCRRLVVLVANAGDNMEYAPSVAQQILRLAKAHSARFIGVTGWPVSTEQSIEGLRLLTSAHIPVVSSTASSDALSAFSPYFFRMVPPDSEQGPIGARYAEQAYPTCKIAIVFFDQQNPYSKTLASAFLGAFTKPSEKQVILEAYGASALAAQRTAAIKSDLQDALSRPAVHPDTSFIYFAAYSEDFSRLLSSLNRDYQEYRQMPRLSGDSAHDRRDFLASSEGATYTNLTFTAFAYSGEWNGQKMPHEVEAFFSHYREIYGADRQNVLPSADTILTYDAARLLFQAALNAGTSSGPDIQKALAGFDQSQPFQGVSGAIAFAPDENPIQKAILVLRVDAKGTVLFSSQYISQGHLLACKPQQRC
ncbi:MAG TPA: ABC transporter substrate-binding protein [Ktedonobacteraceae bacterium]|jgi:ABC-type branched-subunit amino acid transport system substrate-binding protein